MVHEHNDHTYILSSLDSLHAKLAEQTTFLRNVVHLVASLHRLGDSVVSMLELSRSRAQAMSQDIVRKNGKRRNYVKKEKQRRG